MTGAFRPGRAPRVLLTLCLALLHSARAQEVRWAIGGDPPSFDPAQVEDGTEETVRYLTGGVLIRINRHTQAPEKALADTWSVAADGRTIVLHLRAGLCFSDGSPLTSKDVAWTFHHLLDPATQSPIAEEFIIPARVIVETPDPLTVKLKLPLRLVAFEPLLDEIAIQPAGKPPDSRITAGMYVVSDYERGRTIHLRLNSHYWKREGGAPQGGSVTSILLEVMPNREEELSRFRRGELLLIDDLPPEYVAMLDQRMPGAAHDAGPSLDTEQLWFNQSPAAPLPEQEKSWFRNQAFRIAVAEAIRRSDLVRIAFAGHATPADSFISPANAQWRNTQLRIPRENPQDALQRLHAAGFVTREGSLYDGKGNPVSFSILTNAGNTSRERMAALIQQDLALIGMRVNIVTLDFPALVERLLHTQNYEACLLGVVNVQPDPATGANVWLSSSEDHSWNAKEPKPATPWEAEMDDLIRRQADSPGLSGRKAMWDRIQQIVADQQPFIYLVHRDVLFAASAAIEGLEPSPLRPQILWNIDSWKLKTVPH